MIFLDPRKQVTSTYIIAYALAMLTPRLRSRYLILDVLGQGTFGQVVKCQNLKTQEVVAVKVVKNRTAYFNQSMMEVSVLDLVNLHDIRNHDCLLTLAFSSIKNSTETTIIIFYDLKTPLFTGNIFVLSLNSSVSTCTN